MNKYLRNFISSFLAGICIVIGATIYLLNVEQNKLIGALLFSLGLYTIVVFKLNLFTGKVGFFLDSKNKLKYILNLLICLLGNFAGVIVFSGILKLTRDNTVLTEQATILVNTKLSDNWYSILILSFMCGIMIYLAVKGHQKCEYSSAKSFFVIIPIVVFIICQFEHCIANTCYYIYSGIFNLEAFCYLLIMILGNGLGSIFFDGVLKVVDKLKPLTNEE